MPRDACSGSGEVNRTLNAQHGRLHRQQFKVCLGNEGGHVWLENRVGLKTGDNSQVRRVLYLEKKKKSHLSGIPLKGMWVNGRWDHWFTPIGLDCRSLQMLDSIKELKPGLPVRIESKTLGPRIDSSVCQCFWAECILATAVCLPVSAVSDQNRTRELMTMQ